MIGTLGDATLDKHMGSSMNVAQIHRFIAGTDINMNVAQIHRFIADLT